MFDDGVKEKHADEEVRVQDIAEILVDALQQGTPDGHPDPAGSPSSTFRPGI